MNNAEILIIDDEPQIRKLIKITLESNDYKVVLAKTGTEGVQLVANHTPDLVILDLGLPDKSGHLVLKDLREWYDKSIIILSVQDSEADIIKALDNGATDYLTKPFRIGELLARIRASLRINQNTDLQPVVATGNLEIDLSSRIVGRKNTPVKLTAIEYNLVALLAKNQGRVLTHQFLFKEIWGFGPQNETQYLRFL
jgi:two-component system KDP operon response regulator KdpE